jgi:hypothetical protein
MEPSATELGMSTATERDTLREALVDAIMEADGGPDEEQWEAENMADDILDTPSGRNIRTEIDRASRVTNILRLVLLRHHTGPDDIAKCDVCSAAMTVLE